MVQTDQRVVEGHACESVDGPPVLEQLARELGTVVDAAARAIQRFGKVADVVAFKLKFLVVPIFIILFLGALLALVLNQTSFLWESDKTNNNSNSFKENVTN